MTEALNTLLLISRPGVWWKMALLICFSAVMLTGRDAAANDVNRSVNRESDAAGYHIERQEKRIGPFKIQRREFTVILELMKYEGAQKGFDETVASVSIVDDHESFHYEKSFLVEYANGGFAESVAISAYALESNRRGFGYESGKLRETAFKEPGNEGLILYYGFSPSAPSTGVSCQVFALRKDRLVPLFSPLTVYGNIYELARGSGPDTQKLFDGNTMRFGIWTGWVEVIVPVNVLDSLRVAPLHHDITFRFDAFDVRVERGHFGEETFVRLFHVPDASSIPKHVIIRKDTKVEFLEALARVSVESDSSATVLSIADMPWLKVRIDGKEGFVRDEEDLMSLGIEPAG